MANGMTQEEKDMNDALSAMNDVVKRFGLTVGALNDYTKKNIKAEGDSTTAKKDGIKQNGDLARTVKNLDYSYREMSKSAESFIGSFRNSSNVFLATISILAEKAVGLGKQWQGMSEMGQTFGGSIINMVGAQKSAGLSLDEMSDAYRKHNTVISATNGKFFDMSKQLRLSTISAANYGMSVEQMNDFVGDSLEVSRKNGTLQSMSTSTVVKDMDDLASETTMLASSSDKARTEIMKLANEAMGSALSIAAMRTTPVEIRGAVEKSVKEITLGFASLPGEAGSFFSKFYADSKAGAAALTEQGKTLIDAGVGGMVSSMTALASKPNASLADQVDYNNKFVDYINANMQTLKIQAIAGNQAAAQVITMSANMKKMSIADMEKQQLQKKSADSFTAFMVTLESNFTMLKESFFGSFAKSLSNIFGPMDKFTASKTMERLQKIMGDFGTLFGDKFAKMLNIAGPGGLEDTIKGIISGIEIVGNALLGLSKGVLIIIDIFDKAASPFRWVFSKVGLGMSDIAEALIIAVAAVKAFTTVMAIKNFLGGLGGGAPKALAAAGGEAAEVAEVAGGGGLLAMLKKSGGKLGGAGRGLLSRFGIGGAEAAAEGGAMAEGGSLLGGLIGLPGLALAGGAAVGMGGNYLADRYIKNKNSLGHKTASIGSDAAGGALAGAGIGALFGGVGAVPGALIGGALGAGYGVYKNWGDQDEKKPDAAKPDDPAADNQTTPSQNGISEKENHDNIGKIVDEMTEQTAILNTMLSVLNSRMTETNRLLQNTNRSLN